MALLSRDNFREGVFKRDLYKCVFPGCGKPAEDAHHIIERRLWTSPREHGGYFMSNGASVCEYHHQYGAETCAVAPQVLRMWCRIADTKVPESFDPLKAYDKWGVPMKRPSPGRIKYPSTQYLPDSPGQDKGQTLQDLKPFLEIPTILTVKMDGSNVCLTRAGVAARNGDRADHPSFGLLKERAVIYCPKIPEGLQIFGEWLLARHSIPYEGDMAVRNYLQLFSVYDNERELFLGWDEVVRWAAILEVPTVPVVGEYIFKNEGEARRTIISAATDVIDAGHEGVVLRTIYPFHYGMFEGYDTKNKSVWHVVPLAKYVRADHLQTDGNWGRHLVKNTESAEV